jgi:hypothetical protein
MAANMARPCPADPIEGLDGWWLRTGCSCCRILVDVSVRALLGRGVAGPVGGVARRLRCRRDQPPLRVPGKMLVGHEHGSLAGACGR